MHHTDPPLSIIERSAMSTFMYILLCPACAFLSELEKHSTQIQALRIQAHSISTKTNSCFNGFLLEDNIYKGSAE